MCSNELIQQSTFDEIHDMMQHPTLVVVYLECSENCVVILHKTNFMAKFMVDFLNFCGWFHCHCHKPGGEKALILQCPTACVDRDSGFLQEFWDVSGIIANVDLCMGPMYIFPFALAETRRICSSQFQTLRVAMADDSSDESDCWCPPPFHQSIWWKEGTTGSFLAPANKLIFIYFH